VVQSDSVFSPVLQEVSPSELAAASSALPAAGAAILGYSETSPEVWPARWL